MTLDEVYLYYGSQWTNITNALGASTSLQQYWQRRGSIPISTQRKIEELTNGDLKADIRHDSLCIAKQKAVAIKAERVKQKMITKRVIKATQKANEPDLQTI